jgi:trigger factor
MSKVEIKNILNKDLKKDYQITVPYSFIEKRIDNIVLDIQKNYKQKGFRTGQVPTDLIKQKYENSIMAEESEKIINENSKKIIEENKLKLALPPKVDIKVFEPKKDFEYTVSMEIFPEVPEIDLAKIKLSKRKVDITKTDIEDASKKILANFKEWKKQDGAIKSKMGDAVNIDYVGKIDKQVFEGGSAQGYQLELGSKSFIDDFEKQLVGKKAGDEVKVKVKFPKEYHNKEFAGKAAEFEVKINSILHGIDPVLTDEFVKNSFGLENVAKLDEAIKNQVEANYESMSRNLFKKELFDFLNKKFDIEVPQGLVDEQFNRVWAETEEELKTNPEKFKSPKEQEKAKAEQRKLAEKMVRNGVLLSELSQRNKVLITQNDLIEEINKKARQFPGQEKMIAEYYQKNPEAVQDLRGAILEEKTVDLILEKGAIETKKISIKDFEKEFSKLSE